MQPFPPQWQPASSGAAERRRGFFLGSFVVTGILGDVIGGALSLLGAASASAQAHAAEGIDGGAASAARASHNSLLFLALLAFCSAGCLSGVWMWKKWGVFGYGALAVLGLVIGLRVSPASSVANIVWGGLVAISIFSKWRYFE